MNGQLGISIIIVASKSDVTCKFFAWTLGPSRSEMSIFPGEDNLPVEDKMAPNLTFHCILPTKP